MFPVAGARLTPRPFLEQMEKVKANPRDRYYYNSQPNESYRDQLSTGDLSFLNVANESSTECDNTWNVSKPWDEYGVDPEIMSLKYPSNRPTSWNSRHEDNSLTFRKQHEVCIPRFQCDKNLTSTENNICLTGQEMNTPNYGKQRQAVFKSEIKFNLCNDYPYLQKNTVKKMPIFVDSMENNPLQKRFHNLTYEDDGANNNPNYRFQRIFPNLASEDDGADTNLNNRFQRRFPNLKSENDGANTNTSHQFQYRFPNLMSEDDGSDTNTNNNSSEWNNSSINGNDYNTDVHNNSLNQSIPRGMNNLNIIPNSNHPKHDVLNWINNYVPIVASIVVLMIVMYMLIFHNTPSQASQVQNNNQIVNVSNVFRTLDAKRHKADSILHHNNMLIEFAVWGIIKCLAFGVLWAIDHRIKKFQNQMEEMERHYKEEIVDLKNEISDLREKVTYHMKAE